MGAPNTMKTRLFALLFALLSILLLAACGGEDGGSSGGTAPTDDGGDGPTATAGQGGAQDIGLFRAVLDSGQIPGPNTLDDVGFFNEHAFGTEADPCTDALCVSGRLGVMGNMLNGANCTLVMVTMTTAAQLDVDERPPLNLAIAVDTSAAMGGNIEAVRQSLAHLRTSLRPDDRVSLVTFDTRARLLVDGAAGDDPDLELWFDNLRAEGDTNLYDGLRLALERTEQHHGEERIDRVMLLSGSVPNTGILFQERIVRLVDSYARQGIGLTVIGYGQPSFLDPTLLIRLAESGAGNFYSVSNGEDLIEVFSEELATTLVPVAVDVQLSVDSADGYRLRRIHGTHRATLNDLHSASIDIPAVFVAHRKGASDDGLGRRGGGGAILIELVPTDGATALDVGTLHLSWRLPGQEETKEQTVEIRSTLAPGVTPETGLFDDEIVEKGFVALNVYAGLYGATVAARRLDLMDALGTLQRLDASVAAWLTTHPDADIADDLALIRRFEEVLLSHGATSPPPSWIVPDPWVVD